MDEGGKNKQSLSFNSLQGEDNIDSSNQVLLEEVHSEVISLSYTFFLIPEIPSYLLEGELIELLPEWLNKICVSNGWKLEFVTVDPKYLQWALTVSPSVFATQVVLQARTELTKWILDATKEKLDLKDSTDLWAQGYLLLHGLHQNVSGIIEQYISLIREQQQKYSI